MTSCWCCVSEWSVLDPVLEEEKAAQGHLSVYLHLDGTITGLEHTGTVAYYHYHNIVVIIRTQSIWTTNIEIKQASCEENSSTLWTIRDITTQEHLTIIYTSKDRNVIVYLCPVSLSYALCYPHDVPALLFFQPNIWIKHTKMELLHEGQNIDLHLRSA